MLDLLLASAELAIRVDVLVYTAGGLLLGMCVGAIPGLTTTAAMAILLPLSFFVEPIIGIPFLIGVYKGGIYGGSISAILISTPGTGASVATTFDGPHLVRQGKGRKALDMALYASVVGDFTSDCITIILIGPIAALALLLGPPELVPIILIALLIVIMVSSSSISRALAMALIGLLLASVGRDPIEFSSRLTFGLEQLEQGIPMLPMLVGLFAVPEIIRMIGASKLNRLVHRTVVDTGSRLTLKEFLNCARTIARSTMIGTVLGMIPGIGQPVAAFTGYAAAKRASKDPDSFGKGALEGIAAAEASNNAVNGPTLVPMLTLGIPGDKITALLMGAFIAHGLRPGPELFEEHGTLIMAMLLSMLFANILLLGVAKLFIPIISRLVKLSPSILAPMVLVLAFMGAYLYRSDPNDLYFLVAFGFLGIITKRFDYDVTPLVLGFIVAEPLEYAIGQTLSLAGPDLGSYLLGQRPVALTLFIILLTLLLWLILRKYIARSSTRLRI